MAKERLSKFQNWILRQIYQNSSITKKGLKKFYGKGLRDALTNKERVIIHRSLNNMLNRQPRPDPDDRPCRPVAGDDGCEDARGADR